MIFQSLNHVGLTVSDLQKSVDWYKKILEFKLLGHSEINEKDTEEIFMLKNIRVNVAMLIAGWGGLVELFEFNPSKGKRSIEYQMIGLHHFAIGVSNIQKQYKRLKKLGVKILFTPKFISGVEFFYFEDPDGNVIEYIGFNPLKSLSLLISSKV